jgi:pimeloyl-ACP methyl ester carboxylesterase
MNGAELQLLPHCAPGEQPVSIAYRYRKPKENKSTFVWFPGFKSEMESVKASALDGWACANGAGCLRFDYSGHGKSGGRFEDGTISAWLAQAAAVYEHALAGMPAVFVGSSMGGWIALLLARRLDQTAAPEGIVLIAPAWDMTRLFRERATDEARGAIMRESVYYRPSAYGDGPYAITKALIEDGRRHLFGHGPIPLSQPVRILHGCQDPDIPWRHSLRLLDIIGSPDMRLTLIKDGEHRLSRPRDLALLFVALGEFL